MTPDEATPAAAGKPSVSEAVETALLLVELGAKVIDGLLDADHTPSTMRIRELQRILGNDLSERAATLAAIEGGRRRLRAT